MHYAAEKTRAPKQESGLKLIICVSNESSRNSINFRNKECKSYENDSESIHIKTSLIVIYQGEVRRKNAAA